MHTESKLIYMRKWRSKNRDRLKLYNAKYWKNNPCKLRYKRIKEKIMEKLEEKKAIAMHREVFLDTEDGCQGEIL